jgi:PLD-like domain
VSQFDIAQYADFRPPRYLCPRCASIWPDYPCINWPEKWDYFYDDTRPEAWTCCLCNLRFEATREYSDLEGYLRRWDCLFEFADLTNHLQVLASAAKELRCRESWSERPPRSLHNLLAALNQARHFVHFVSTGLSWDFIGMLALLSHRVSVRGVISMDDEAKARQLLKARDYGSDKFEVVPLSPSEFPSRPHQKLIVIDGFLAITGSPNLTIQAWCNLDVGNEHLVVETRPEEVWALNNSLFSPIWHKLHPVRGNTVAMRYGSSTWFDSIKNH